MSPDLAKLLRPLGALVVVAIACPAALFGGALLGCAAQGFTAECAVTGALVSPFFLAAAGILAGLLTRGWTGLAVVLVGVVVGMVSIPVLAAAAGNPVPIDPWQGVFATFWFVTPVALGYGIARAVARHLARRAAAARPPVSRRGAP